MQSTTASTTTPARLSKIQIEVRGISAVVKPSPASRYDVDGDSGDISNE